MQIILHRVNSIEKLLSIDRNYGLEVDIRSYKDELVIHHDPFQPGESFNQWLDHVNHALIIANVKEEGLEEHVIKAFEKRKIRNFFFLDQSFPFLLKWARKGERRSAVRFSDYESIDTVLTLAGLVDWVWIDCFERLSLTLTQNELLKESGFKTCLVSPELQGRNLLAEAKNLHFHIQRNELTFDAVCTKNPKFWEQYSYDF